MYRSRLLKCSQLDEMFTDHPTNDIHIIVEANFFTDISVYEDYADKNGYKFYSFNFPYTFKSGGESTHLYLESSEGFGGHPIVTYSNRLMTDSNWLTTKLLFLISTSFFAGYLNGRRS